MIILENYVVTDSFLEKETNFSVASGLSVDCLATNGYVKIHVKFSISDVFYEVHDFIPPIDLVIDKLIIEFNADQYADTEMVVEHLNLKEGKKLLWDASSVREPKGAYDISASIELPESVKGFPYEIEILEVNGMKSRHTKDAQHIKLAPLFVHFYALNSLITYRARVRIAIAGKYSEWSNWVPFKPRKRRSIGRTF